MVAGKRFIVIAVSHHGAHSVCIGIGADNQIHILFLCHFNG